MSTALLAINVISLQMIQYYSQHCLSLMLYLYKWFNTIHSITCL